MKPTIRIIIVATVVSVVFGFVAALVAALAGEPPATIRHSFTTLQGVVGLIFIGSLSLPMSVPAGLAGGGLLARVAAKQPTHWGGARWTAFGALCGVAVGAAVPVVIAAPRLVVVSFMPIAPDLAESLPFLAVMAAIGSVAGFVVGAIVGLYCSRLLRVGTVGGV